MSARTDRHNAVTSDLVWIIPFFVALTGMIAFFALQMAQYT